MYFSESKSSSSLLWWFQQARWGEINEGGVQQVVLEVGKLE